MDFLLARLGCKERTDQVLPTKTQTQIQIQTQHTNKNTDRPGCKKGADQTQVLQTHQQTQHSASSDFYTQLLSLPDPIFPFLTKPIRFCKQVYKHSIEPAVTLIPNHLAAWPNFSFSYHSRLRCQHWLWYLLTLPYPSWISYPACPDLPQPRFLP